MPLTSFKIIDKIYHFQCLCLCMCTRLHVSYFIKVLILLIKRQMCLRQFGKGTPPRGAEQKKRAILQVLFISHLYHCWRYWAIAKVVNKRQMWELNILIFTHHTVCLISVTVCSYSLGLLRTSLEAVRSWRVEGPPHFSSDPRNIFLSWGFFLLLS